MQGGGFYCAGNTYPILTNNIIRADTASGEGDEFYVDGSPMVTYCDIEGGWEGEGNIDLPPLFRDPSGSDFHLMSTSCGDPSDSPCIDAGDPSIIDNLLHCDWGLGAVRSDMGAFGGEETPTAINEQHNMELPSAISLLQNYPNPFNNATAIRYRLDSPGSVELSIYDLLGRKITTIFEGYRNAGEHTVLWDAAHWPSGVYFAKIEGEKYSRSIKLVLLN